MFNINRRISTFILAIALVLPLTPAGAAPFAPAFPSAQSEYTQWYDRAMSFADSIGKISDRYGVLLSNRLTEVRLLLASSAQAAQAQDFATAGKYAQQAYELLSSSLSSSNTSKGK